MIGKSENGELKPKIGGFRIRILNYIFIAALAVLAVILFVVTLSLSREYAKVIQIADDYQKVEQNAEMVQFASDDLTKSVHFFVMTGKQAYLDEYFTEANVTRRRETAIGNLKQMHVTDSLFHLLDSAVNESMKLMVLEYHAMRYAAEGYGLELSTLPEVVQTTPLPPEAESMSAQEKIDKAHDLVFGYDYLSYKEKISNYNVEFLENAVDLMQSLESAERSKLHWLLLVQRLAIAMIVALGAVLFMTISQLVVRPLDKAVQHISSGEKVDPLKGTYEIQYMSHIYNEFHSDSKELQKRLKQDAERDALTGVLNRRGYQTVIDKLASETFPLAVLVFDIDEFKSVNDNFGHEVGDLALTKTANLLRNTFRATDITSRIGGDEFTVILLDVTSENLPAIAAKARSINAALQAPGPDSCPAFSVSIGCAFSPAGYNSHAFKRADEKMYEAKNAGGGDIRFDE